MTVWDSVVGQREQVAALVRAARAAGEQVAGRSTAAGEMTHAWLFTGPPGSGRSVAARAFAAALQCADAGCGSCPACRTIDAGTHSDVRLVAPEGLSISVAQAREIVRLASSAPSAGRWQVVIVEDADRLTEGASNALLKAVEEPPPRGVFLLCAPSTHPDDVSVTIRSRCRVVALGAPPADAVAEVLVARDGVERETALWAARAAQGHIGRARRLATDEQARARREAVLGLPASLRGVGACYEAADRLIAAVEEEAVALTSDRDATETEELAEALGAGGTGRRTSAATRGSAGPLKELAGRQRSRRTRTQRDALDRALVDLAAFYRDALVVRFGADVAPVHTDVAAVTGRAARAWTPEVILGRLEAVLACRAAIDANVKPRIAVEAMALELRGG